VKCGIGLDWLRSCYKTQAQLVQGGPPVDITWWWTDQPQLMGHHPWGSANWCQPVEDKAVLGELPGAPRPWYSGARPANACVEVAITPCRPSGTPLVLFATVQSTSTSVTFPLNFDKPSGLWVGTLSGAFLACDSFAATFGCADATDPSSPLWSATLRYGKGGVALPYYDGATEALRSYDPLVWSMPTPNGNLQCAQGGLSIQGFEVTETAPGRTGRVSLLR
jgi:hypothetical protein